MSASSQGWSTNMEPLADRNGSGSVKVYLGWDVRVAGTFLGTGKLMTWLIPSNSFGVHVGGQGPGPVTDENATAAPDATNSGFGQLVDALSAVIQ
jgi:hypothetical protein